LTIYQLTNIDFSSELWDVFKYTQLISCILLGSHFVADIGDLDIIVKLLAMSLLEQRFHVLVLKVLKLLFY